MKCRYKQKAAEKAEQRQIEVYGDLTDQFLAFLDYTKGMAMHDLFGHGKVRLDTLYKDHHLLLATIMNTFEDKEDPDPRNYSKNTLELYDGLLKNAGVDIEDLKKGYVIEDRYKEPVLPRDKEFWNPIHANRAMFVQEFDRYSTTSVAAWLSYINDKYGFGKVRLERAFHWVWGRYVKFCEHYLLTKKEGDAAVSFLLKSSRDYLKTLNLEIFRDFEEDSP